jgi:hypothetical protein
VTNSITTGKCRTTTPFSFIEELHRQQIFMCDKKSSYKKFYNQTTFKHESQVAL